MKLMRNKKTTGKIVVSSIFVAALAVTGVGFWVSGQQTGNIAQENSANSAPATSGMPPRSSEEGLKKATDAKPVTAQSESSDSISDKDITTYTVNPKDVGTASESKNIEVTQRGSVISYTNKDHTGKNSEHLRGKIFQAVAEARQINPADNGQAVAGGVDNSEARYYLETDEGIREVSIEGISLKGVADFDGQVVKDGGSTVASSAAISVPQVAAAPAVRSHKIKILRIQDGGTKIATEAQLKNIAATAGTYWVNNSNGYITSSSVTQTKSISKSNICSMDDSSIFTLLLNQFGYTSLTNLRNSVPDTTLVVAIPGSCSKSYAGLAYTGTGLNDSGIVIMKNSVGGILTNSSGTSSNQPGYIDQRGAYNNLTLAHEMGHTFGLGHSGSMNTAKGWVAYNDYYSIMGGTYNTYTLPTLDGYYRDVLGISTTANNEKVGVLLSDPYKIATSMTVRPLNSTTVASRYLKIVNPTTGMAFYVDYRSGNANDNLSYYAEDSFLHIFPSSRFCAEPGITISSEATRYSGVASGSMGAVDGSPNIARIASDTLSSYNSFNSTTCYKAYTNSSFQIAGNFALYVSGTPNVNTGITVKIKPLNQPFKDVSSNTFRTDIAWMYQNGIAAGNENYNPDASVKRGEMAAFMYRLAKKPAFTPTAAEQGYYTDINGSNFKNPILWMARKGITVTRGEYGINQSVSRSQMAAFMYRLAGSPAFTPTAAELQYYTDVPNDSNLRNAILWAARTGVTNTRGIYGFNDPVSRGQMAAFMQRLNTKVTHYVYY